MTEAVAQGQPAHDMPDLDVQLTYRAPQFEPSNPNAGAGKETFKNDTREPYQRDLGRVVHSASFRRLQTKTQVMGTGEGDFHRTRLTHTLEVGHIGRGIVWNLTAQSGSDKFKQFLPPSELIEAICYAHDLGHPPFGHAGERALHEKMITCGGFEGNAQTIRILTRLEKYYRGEGIRPTRRLLLGVLKYPVAYSDYEPVQRELKPPKCYYDVDKPLVERALSIFSQRDQAEFRKLGANGKPKYKTFDCSVMELADDIAYGVHDLEDGIARGVLRREYIERELKKGFREAGIKNIREITISKILKKLFSADTCERKHAISLLVGFFILSIEVRSRNVFDSPHLDLAADVPQQVRSILDVLAKKITYDGVVNRREIQTLEFKGQKIVGELFDAFASKPLELVGASALDPFGAGVQKILLAARKKGIDWRKLSEEEQKQVARAISDFVSGMTNPYAEKYHRRLFEPGFGSSTDEL